MAKLITLAKDTIDKRDLSALAKWLLTNPKLTLGDQVLAFEKAYAEKMGVKYAVMVNSGSSANLMMLYTLMVSGKLKKGDVVAVPAVSWATDLAPVIQLGLKPVLVDCNMHDLSIDLDDFRKVCENYSPKALILVSVLGIPPQMDAIETMCSQFKCFLLEDNCESLGSEIVRPDGDTKKLGQWGYMASMSFYFGHHISTIEGGMVTTNDEWVYWDLLMIRSHGWDRNLPQVTKDHLSEKYKINPVNKPYTFYSPGFNLRPTEINGFLGLRQLKKMDRFCIARKENFWYYRDNIKSTKGSIVLRPSQRCQNFISSLGYPLIREDRDELMQKLTKAGIECRPLISGSMEFQPMFKKFCKDLRKSERIFAKENGFRDILQNAKKVHEQGLYLPNHPSLTIREMDKVIKIVNS